MQSKTQGPLSWPSAKAVLEANFETRRKEIRKLIGWTWCFRSLVLANHVPVVLDRLQSDSLLWGTGRGDTPFSSLYAVVSLQWFFFFLLILTSFPVPHWCKLPHVWKQTVASARLSIAQSHLPLSLFTYYISSGLLDQFLDPQHGSPCGLLKLGGVTPPALLPYPFQSKHNPKP